VFVCKDCINKFEPVAALATFYKTCEICGERRTCLDLSPNVKRIDSVLELIIENKNGKLIKWSMRDPNDSTRKLGEDDVALIRQVIDGLPEREGGLLPDPYGDGVGWACKCGHGSHSIEQPPNFCPNCGTRLKGEQKANLDEMWEWIDRDLDDGFFETAGKITDKEENQRRMNEIPEVLRPLVHVVIALAYKNKGGGPCILFRHELFAVHKELLKKGINIHLPHAWFCDGVMIEPEWIVRITNGIVGWSCDPDYDNPDTCGLEDCRYRGFNPSIASKERKKRVDPCSHLKDCLSQDDNGLTFNCEDLIDMGLCRLEKKKEILVEEPEIHPDILKAARSDGAAHYSTGDGQQYLVTFIGLKETAFAGPDDPEKVGVD